MTAISDRDQLSYIAAQAADARVNVELETEGMTLNIGPQHPATHGTLRIVAKLDGEQVIAADPIMGYMHRGYEKLTEVRTFPQVTTLINPSSKAFVANQAGKVFDMRDGMNDKGQMTLQAPTTQGLFLYADPPARYLVNTAALDGADATYSLKGCAVNSHDTPSSFSDWASSVTPS